jgi:hypothetical protein
LVARFGKLRYNDNMKLTEHSRNRLLETFKVWDVPKDFADLFYNYLVHGYLPGSCFTSVLANDFVGAIGRSHPNNTVNAFKSIAGWLGDSAPAESYGSYEAVTAWSKLDTMQRRAILERDHLVFTKEDEMMLVLQGKRTTEPVLY